MVGGRGGGKAKLTVGAIMITDGMIEADGGDGSNLSGGGSGGSIWIIAGILFLHIYLNLGIIKT